MKKQLALACLLATASFAATAGDIGYSYVEGGYVRTDIDQIGDGDGFGVNGSVAVHDNVFLFGGYSMQDASEQGVEVDLDAMRLGAGFNWALGKRADFVATAAYERTEWDVSVVDLGSAEARVDGYSLEAGFRGQLSVDGDIEGWAMAGYADIDDVEAGGMEFETEEGEDDDVYGRAGLLFKFNPTWGVVAESRFNSDARQYFVGVRASF